jgi:hypothetical protein
MNHHNAVIRLDQSSTNLLDQIGASRHDSIAKIEVVGITGNTMQVETERMTAMRSTTIMFRTGHRHRGMVTVHHDVGDVSIQADNIADLQGAVLHVRITPTESEQQAA